jgi:hypothetical protein
MAGRSQAENGSPNYLRMGVASLADRFYTREEVKTGAFTRRGSAAHAAAGRPITAQNSANRHPACETLPNAPLSKALINAYHACGGQHIAFQRP